MELNRRDFLKGTAALGGAAALAGIAGCSSGGSSSTTSSTNSGDSEAEDTSLAKVGELTASSTYDCDVAIVGGGFSGLTACVEAASDGATVIVIESSTMPGGNGIGVEGTFGVDSSMQKEQGIVNDRVLMLQGELSQSQWRASGLVWKKLIAAAGDNIDWLIKQGVEFNGEINDYHTGGFVTMHWYKDGKASVGYVDPMYAKAQELGVQFLFSKTAKRLIASDDGTIVGVYAADENGDWIQVNAKAVVLASGGFGADNELITHIGYKPEDIYLYGSKFNAGYGFKMAHAAGCKDMTYYAADNCHATILALPHDTPVHPINTGMTTAGQFVWINQDCQRFVEEDCAKSNFEYQNPPKWNQKEWYFVWDTSIYENFCQGMGLDFDYDALLADAVSTNEGNTLYKADTIADLAKPFGLDAGALQDTIDHYNEMCAAGSDTDWHKDPAFMLPLSTPPFYIAKPMSMFLMSIGGIATNENSQVIDDNLDPIPGLYAIGVDGCMLYRNVYTINCPGSCSGNSVFTGRTAAQHAVENCL